MYVNGRSCLSRMAVFDAGLFNHNSGCSAATVVKASGETPRKRGRSRRPGDLSVSDRSISYRTEPEALAAYRSRVRDCGLATALFRGQ